MKSNKEILLDIIYMKKKNNEKYIEEIRNSLDIEDKFSGSFLEYDIEKLEEENEYLDEIRAFVITSIDGLKYVKNSIKKFEKKQDYSIIVSKYNLMKNLIKNYKIEYNKNYKINNSVGTKGVFDNNLFCEVIKKQIFKYTNCNIVTKKKYSNLVAFLNEILHEMESSNDPLKTLKEKMKLYEKYKNSEYVIIRNNKVSKVEVLGNIIDEYNSRKEILR